jgi:hypothetical protein
MAELLGDTQLGPGGCRRASVRTPLHEEQAGMRSIGAAITQLPAIDGREA